MVIESHRREAGGWHIRAQSAHEFRPASANQASIAITGDPTFRGWFRVVLQVAKAVPTGVTALDGIDGASTLAHDRRPEPLRGQYPNRVNPWVLSHARKDISGGDTGASQAAWRAAAAFGVPTGGWMPNGFLTDDGPHPEFAEQYGAAELPADSELAISEQNVKDSDATLWFGRTTTAGAHATVAACLACGRPYMPVYPARRSSRRTSPRGSWRTRSRP